MNLLELPGGTEEDESYLYVCTIGCRQLWVRKESFKRHRLRGPAAITNGGQEFWFRDDKPYEPTAHEKMLWEQRKKNECS